MLDDLDAHDSPTALVVAHRHAGVPAWWTHCPCCALGGGCQRHRGVHVPGRHACNDLSNASRQRQRISNRCESMHDPKRISTWRSRVAHAWLWRRNPAVAEFVRCRRRAVDHPSRAGLKRSSSRRLSRFAPSSPLAQQHQGIFERHGRFDPPAVCLARTWRSGGFTARTRKGSSVWVSALASDWAIACGRLHGLFAAS